MLTSPKPFALVLMPFSDAFDNAYQLAIKPACEAAGAYAERVDEQIFSGSILDRVYNQIAKADVIVADMTGRNANVFYEVGYAHALGKSTILLTQTTDDIPFDLKHYPHIVYQNKLTSLKSQLELRVRWHLENPSAIAVADSELRGRINGITLEGNTVVDVKVSGSVFGIDLLAEFENHISQRITNIECRVGLVAPSFLVDATTNDNFKTTVVALDSETSLILAGRDFDLLPGTWGTMGFTAWTDGQAMAERKLIPFALRIFRKSGVRDFPFSLRFIPDEA